MLTVEKILILRNLDVFTGLSGETLSGVAAIAGEVEVKAEQVIAPRGEISDQMYVIVTGRVGLVAEDGEMTEVGEGRTFGVRCCLDPRERETAATALDDGLLLRIGHDHLLELVSEDVNLARGLIRYLCRR